MAKREHVLSVIDGAGRTKYLWIATDETFVESALIGGYGTGKSNALTDYLALSCLNYPGARVLMARNKRTDVKRSTLPTFLKRYGALLEYENNTEGVYKFPREVVNGVLQPPSEFWIIGLDRPDLEDMMKSTEWFRVGLEEANEMIPEIHNLVLARTRQQVQHKSKTNKFYVQDKAAQWGVSHDEAKGIIQNFSPKFDITDNMLGFNQVKSVFNPGGTDEAWMRYVGVNYPTDGITPEWADKNMGIRRVYTSGDKLEEDRYPFLAGDLVEYQGNDGRFYEGRVGKFDVQTNLVHIIGVDARVFRKDVTLISERAAMYIFPWENESRNLANVKNQYLITDESFRRRAFHGVVDMKTGLVFPEFNPEIHVLKRPKKDIPKSITCIGGVDQGGRHPTAAVIAYVNSTRRLFITAEYLQANMSAGANADAISKLIPFGRNIRWLCDPSMRRIAYESDSMESAIDKYREYAIELEPAPLKGDEAFILVKGLLEPKSKLIGEEPLPDLFVFEDCELTIEMFQTLRWEDVKRGRDKWQVDMGDAVKYMVSGRAPFSDSEMQTSVLDYKPNPVIPSWQDDEQLPARLFEETHEEPQYLKDFVPGVDW